MRTFKISGGIMSINKHWESGYVNLQNKLIKDKNIDAYEFRILVLLQSFWYVDGGKEASISYISNVTGISKHKVHSSIGSLIKKKYINLKEKHGENTPAKYEIIIDTEVKINAGGVPHGNRGCSSQEQGVFLTGTKELTIKRTNYKKKREGENASIESNDTQGEMQNDNCLSPKKDIKPQDENAKQIMDTWQNQSVLPKIKYNHMIFMNLCIFISSQEKRGIYTSGLLKCIENYGKTVSHPNTWRKSKLTLQAFFGLNGSKPCFEPFLDEMFDINDSLKERIESEEDRLRDIMKRSGMSSIEIDKEIERGYKEGLIK